MELKCYNHPDIYAIGRCSVCGRPVCRACSQTVMETRFCMECLDKFATSKEEARHERPLGIKLLGWLNVIMGLVGLMFGSYILTHPVNQITLDVLTQMGVTDVYPVGWNVLLLAVISVTIGFWLARYDIRGFWLGVIFNFINCIDAALAGAFMEAGLYLFVVIYIWTNRQFFSLPVKKVTFVLRPIITPAQKTTVKIKKKTQKKRATRK